MKLDYGRIETIIYVLCKRAGYELKLDYGRIETARLSVASVRDRELKLDYGRIETNGGKFGHAKDIKC